MYQGDDTYTLAELTGLTRAKRRSVQFWAETGALHADPETERAGTGTHRRFSRSEAIVACMLAELAFLKLSIGELVRRAAALRKWIDNEADWIQLEDVIAGKREMIVFAWRSTEEYPEHPLFVFISAPDTPLETYQTEFAEQVLRAVTEPQALMICIPMTPRLRALA